MLHKFVIFVLFSLIIGLLPSLFSRPITRTATRNCQTRKRACHFYSPGVVRRSHAAVRHVRDCPTPAAAAGVAVYRQLDLMSKSWNELHVLRHWRSSWQCDNVMYNYITNKPLAFNKISDLNLWWNTINISTKIMLITYFRSLLVYYYRLSIMKQIIETNQLGLLYRIPHTNTMFHRSNAKSKRVLQLQVVECR